MKISLRKKPRLPPARLQNCQSNRNCWTILLAWHSTENIFQSSLTSHLFPIFLRRRRRRRLKREREHLRGFLTENILETVNVYDTQKMEMRTREKEKKWFACLSPTHVNSLELFLLLPKEEWKTSWREWRKFVTMITIIESWGSRGSLSNQYPLTLRRGKVQLARVFLWTQTMGKGRAMTDFLLFLSLSGRTKTLRICSVTVVFFFSINQNTRREREE